MIIQVITSAHESLVVEKTHWSTWTEAYGKTTVLMSLEKRVHSFTQSPTLQMMKPIQVKTSIINHSSWNFTNAFAFLQRMHLVKGDLYYHQNSRMHFLKENKRIGEIPFLRAGTHDIDRTTHDHERTTAGS